MSFSIQQAARETRNASVTIAALSAERKRKLLMAISQHIVAQTDSILDANNLDTENARAQGHDKTVVDRLMLTKQRVMSIANAVADIAAQPDPVGEVSQMHTLPSGLQVGKMRIPLGVIAMIYEARPQTTTDAAALCLKAGNAVILRGSNEALHSNLALAACIHHVLKEHDLDPALVTLVPNPSRTILKQLVGLKQDIDLVIPRGGEGLIEFVTDHSRIPVIQHRKGVCHLYVDAHARHDTALALLEDGKTRHADICNALETCLVHVDQAASLLPHVARLCAAHGVVVHACERAIDYFDEAMPAVRSDWQAEYLALEIAIKVVDSYDDAVGHIREHGTGHTDVIATDHYQTAQRFIQDVHSAVVMVNASARFATSEQLGMGAEIGVSSSKLHAYGPMGAHALTTEKFVVLGDGEVRQP
ncbi:glutamate-5-semialdehyde dehydrogenase [Alteromonas sp. ASW11-19]|uniref:Gamma-glutamyl phosphate reductase n=1 Tax=Alteromonas salexigens TaxID=2982530 RepID=A0ABT2VJY6_9ALTE|nr:glutamate-5-semialdehyde dehydrogenase [Alteromonas salexigens]MCU7553572.1 glutamate-5-semialdehyde dehydrogenase [Alteromonas salexigens]